MPLNLTKPEFELWEELQPLMQGDKQNIELGFFGPHTHLWLNHRYTIRGIGYPIFVAIINTNPIICDINCRYFTNISELIAHGLVIQKYAFAFNFGDVNTVIKAAYQLRTVHSHVQHTIDNQMRGAFEQELMLFVWAAIIHSSIVVNHTLISNVPFTEQTYNEYKVIGRLVGVSEEYLPKTIQAFDDYWSAEMNKILNVTQQSKDLITSIFNVSLYDVFFKNKVYANLRFIFKPIDNFIRMYCIYLLPSQVASAYDLHLSLKQIKTLKRNIKIIRLLNALLPNIIVIDQRVRRIYKKYKLSFTDKV